MPTLDDYASHSAFSDPGRHATLLDALPGDIGSITAAVRNVIVHYRASGIPFTEDKLAEVQCRWIERTLDTDQATHGMAGPTPLTAPRPADQRVAGCCRDFTLLTVAALRQHGIPARSRIGFAGYFTSGFQHDHVIVEHWDGTAWHSTDAQLEPGADWAIDPTDVPRLVPDGNPAGPVFATAAEVWRAYRAGAIDVDTFGVDPNLPIRGAWMVANYVISELAHRQRDELLLWDGWGAMRAFQPVPADVAERLDEIAGLLVAADAGDADADRALAESYTTDGRLHPGARVVSHSPTGQEFDVDLEARTEKPVATDPRLEVSTH